MKEITRHRLAFDVYFKLGNKRSIQVLRDALVEEPALIGCQRAPSRRSLDVWSSTFHWQDRLLDLERKAQEQDREDQLQALRDMNERHAKEGLALQQKGVERLHSIPTGELSAGDAVRALIEGVRLERLARGEPTDLIRQEGVVLHGRIDLSGFTNEELRRLAQFGDRGSAGTGPSEPG